jgi:hypothetical protein|tara:strand:- start:188 stop:391 length:204 start_codon:yes stop_codon:yes gene_type:complete
MKLSIELVNAILNYLSKKPFNEVNVLMGQIMLEVKKEQEEDQQAFSFSPEEISSSNEKKDTKKNASN